MAYTEFPLDSVGSLNPECVEAVWCFRACGTRPQRILPDGRMDLVAHCMTQPHDRISAVWLAIAGPADAPSQIAAHAGMVSMGVRFRIGWGGSCLGLDPVAMRNSVIAGRQAAQVLGEHAPRLLGARTLSELQTTLLGTASQLAGRPAASAGHRRALQVIQRLSGGREPPETLGRTLRRDVLQTAGLSLRTLSGILRFQRSMHLLQTQTSPSLSDLAMQAGYADQAHMTREFRRFGGFTPAFPAPVPVVGVPD